MEPLDPDFEYPHHRDVLNQLKRRMDNWYVNDEKNFGIDFTKKDFQEIIVDLENQVNYYEANRNTIKLPYLSHLITVPLDEDTYLHYYHYKIIRQKILKKRLSASEIVRELIDNYEKLEKNKRIK